MPEPDDALVRRAVLGDAPAFDALVSRHRPDLVRLCRRAVGDPQLAEDCAQDASLLALLRLQRLREPQQFGAWLRGIGLRVCRRALARSATRFFEVALPETEVPDALAGDDHDRKDDWTDAIAASEMAQVLRRAVDDLPAGQREAVRLFYLGAVTYEEGAAALGINVNALKARLHKARAALREHLLLGDPPPVRPTWDDRTLAIHEAGHAVIHWQRGGLVACVSIAPTAFTSTVGPDPPHGRAMAPRDVLQTLMAGEAATSRQRGRRAGRASGTGDRPAAKAIARHLTAGDEIEATLVVHAAAVAARERLEHQHTWSFVQRVAAALLAHQRIDGDDLRSLLSGAS